MTRIAFGLAAVLSLAVLAGCDRQPAPSGQAMAAAMAPVPVEVITPTRQDLTRRVELIGSVEPWARATIHAKTAGYLKAIFVDKGDLVRKGQMLAIVDVPEMQHEQEQAQAMSRSASADFNLAQAAVKQPQAELRAAEAELEKARRELAMAERAYEASQEMAKEPEVGLEAGEADLRASKSQALEPEAELIAARAALESAQSDLRLAQAEIDRCRADVNLYDRTYQRYKPLADREVVTQQALEEVKAKLEVAQAAESAARARQDGAKAKVKAAEAQILAVQSRKDTAQERVRGAEAKLRMMRQALSTARAQVKTPAARVDIERANLTTIERRLDALRAKVELARLNVHVVQAKLGAAQSNLARLTTLTRYSRIEAPFDGVVTDRFVDPGAMIQMATSSSSAQPLVTVMDTLKVRVFADVPEPDAPFVQVGNVATVAIRELPGREFHGKVARIQSALDPSTRNMSVEVDLENRDGSLRAGMFARVMVGMETRRGVLSISARCLMVDNQKKSVFVVREGKARKVEVQAGADDGVNVEIIAGLSGSDQVLISGMTQVKDGSTVSAKEAAPAASSGSPGY